MRRVGALALLAALAAACGREGDRAQDGAKPAAAVPGIETAIAELQPVRDVVSAFGAVVPAGEAPEMRDARADLVVATARRDLALEQVRRLEALASGAVAPRKELDAARAEETAATGAVARARQVLDTFGTPGVERPLAADETWAIARLLQRDVGRVAAGAVARLIVDAAPERSFLGEVDASPTYVDPGTRLAPARVRVRDPERALRPGMTGAMTIEVGDAHPGVTVPAAAVVLDDAQPVVFVEQAAGRFVAHPVRLGVVREGRAELAAGVAAGARVATTGAASLLSAARLPAGGED